MTRKPEAGSQKPESKNNRSLLAFLSSGSWLPFLFVTSFCAFVLGSVLAFGLGRASTAEPNRIIAIADIHGDVDSFVSILTKTGLIDANRRWAGGKTTLVLTGDFTDRGPKVRAVIDLLMALEREAPRQGGRVRITLGNHEVLNIVGDLRYVTAADYVSFTDAKSEGRRKEAFASYAKLEASKGRTAREPAWMDAHPPGFVEHREAFDPNGKYGRWLRTLPAVIKIEDTVFLHGGISPQLAPVSIDRISSAVQGELKLFDSYKQYMVEQKIALPFYTLEELAAAAKSEMDTLNNAIAQRPQGKDSGGTAAEREHLSRLEGFLGFGGWLCIHPDGPLWFRGYDRWSDQEGEPLISAILTSLQASRIVVGHSPQPGQIRPRFGGKLFLIDTGMLAGYFPEGRPSALELSGAKVTLIYADRDAGRIPLRR